MEEKEGLSACKIRFTAHKLFPVLFWVPDIRGVHLSHVDELGEDLCPLLGRVSAEDHQLHPLGDTIAHHDGALQSWVVPH